MSSIRETTEKLAEGWTNQEHLNGQLADRLEIALRNERYRAANIVNDARFEANVDLRALVARIQTDD